MTSPRQNLGQRGSKGVKRGPGSPRIFLLGFSGSKASVPVSVPKLNFYAFILLFSSLIANKKHMHVPKPRLIESGFTV